MTEHALLSPSGASRWLACTPSARLEKLFEDTSSTAAAEGTLAHAIGELLIRRKLGNLPKKKFELELNTMKTHPLYESSMLDYMEDYALFVLERYHEAQTRSADAHIYLETKFDLRAYIREGFGTGDVTIIGDEILDFVDLKFGKGVLVSAQENKQMMVYALGAYYKYGVLFNIKKVRMTIYQPRLDNIDTYEIDIDALLAWGDTYLRPRAKLAWNGEGSYEPGTHCQFCRARHNCQALADHHLQIAKYEFMAADLMTDEGIADIVNRYDTFVKWIESIYDYALSEAVKGKAWPGLKIVEGRSVRRYTDEKEVVAVLLKAGHQENDLYQPRKIKGITDMTKELGKSDFNKYLSDLLIKPQGAPTLVSVDDKRPPLDKIEQAKNDFESLIDV